MRRGRAKRLTAGLWNRALDLLGESRDERELEKADEGAVAAGGKIADQFDELVGDGEGGDRDDSGAEHESNRPANESGTERPSKSQESEPEPDTHEAIEVPLPDVREDLAPSVDLGEETLYEIIRSLGTHEGSDSVLATDQSPDPEATTGGSTEPFTNLDEPLIEEEGALAVTIAGAEGVASAGFPEPVGAVLKALKLTDRQLEVLRLRYGFPERRTLESVGSSLNVTRERVRQIEVQARNRAAVLTGSVQGAQVLDEFESLLQDFELRELGEFSIAALRELLGGTDAEGGMVQEKREEIDNFVVLIRALVADDRNRPELVDRWRMATFSMCSIEPQIEQHPEVAAQRELLRHESRRWSYEELAVEVLRDAGEPLHWAEIATRARAMNKRIGVHDQSVLNMMIAKSMIFARTDAGTYGLREAGHADVEFYADLIARVLGEAGRPLTASQIYIRVAEYRSGNEGSIKLFLDTHPRFFRSIDQQYGLRAWLRKRGRAEKPEADGLIEDPKSARRVARAVSKGSDVKRMVDADADWMIPEFPKQ
ncbi:hypothetical protein BH23CHL5_BH23CHL5_27520 [soil metagenome]